MKAKREPRYLAWVRGLPCCACGARPPSLAHHQHGEKGTLKGMGMKAPDDTAVALCVICHNAWHSMGRFHDMTRDESITIMQLERHKRRLQWAAILRPMRK